MRQLAYAYQKFVTEISRSETSGTIYNLWPNHSHAPAIIDELYTSQTEGTFVCACAGRYKRVVHESRDCRGNPNIGGNFKVQFVNKLFQTCDICHMPNF